MKYSILIFFITFCCYQVHAQNYTISGQVKEANSQEAVIGCIVTDGKNGVSTNSYGFYSFSGPKGGDRTIIYQFLGYKSQSIAITSVKDTVINIFMERDDKLLSEVTVENTESNLLHKRIGIINVPVSFIKKQPALLGESDLMKSLQQFAGIQSSAEGKSDLTVRGGSPDQNLILLDGVHIYNTNHVFNFVSIFNTDALNNVTLYKSGFPARYGGRLSSVVDITTKDGNKERLTGSATVGILSAKFNLECPIIKDRTSLFVSARRSYMDLYLPQIQDWLSDDDSNEENISNFYFYDLNTKLHHKLNDKMSVYIMAYNGKDKLTSETENTNNNHKIDNYTNKQDWEWGNTIISTKLNWIVTQNLFMNTKLSYNQYYYNTNIHKQHTSEEDANNKITDKLNYDSGIKDYSGDINFEFIPSNNHYIRTGIIFTSHNFKPEVIFKTSDESKSSISSDRVEAQEYSLYAEDEWDIIRKFKLNAGLRFTAFHVKQKTYSSINPSLSLRYLLSDKISIKAGYNIMEQNIHLLSNNSLLLQTDLWLPATDKVKPMQSTQYSVGFYYRHSNNFNISLETYYKDMKDVIEYKDGATYVGMSESWTEKVEAGKGRAYGVELSTEGKIGKTTGTLSYTLAKTERKFNKINFGEWFPAKYDRRHSINLGISHQLNNKIDLIANLTFTSGEMITIPLMSAVIPHIPDSQGDESLPISQLDHRNNYRMPANHRLDVGLNYSNGKTKKRYGKWNFSIYNAYNHMNTFRIFDSKEVIGKADDGSIIYKDQLKKITLFPILPSVSYTYHF